MPAAPNAWPALPYAAWKDTLETLQLWTQVVGKVRLTLTPWLNHSWHVHALCHGARADHRRRCRSPAATCEIDFDFIDHALWLRTSDGQSAQLALKPMAVAEFYAAVMAALAALGVTVRINEMPNEIADAVPFSEDRAHAAYDRDAAGRFHRVLLAVDAPCSRISAPASSAR